MQQPLLLPFLDVRIPVIIQERSAVFQVTLAEVEQSIGTNFMEEDSSGSRRGCSPPSNGAASHHSHILASLGKGPNNLYNWLRTAVSTEDDDNTTTPPSSSALLNMLGLTPDTKLVVKISSSQTANNNKNDDVGSSSSICACIACECNTYGTPPALSEFAALKCVLLQHLSADESKRQESQKRNTGSGSTSPPTSTSDKDILSSPQSPLSYYPFPIPLGVAKFRMPTNRFKVASSVGSAMPIGSSADGDEEEQVVQGIFLVYKKACSMDRLYYDYPDGFDMKMPEHNNSSKKEKSSSITSSRKYMGDVGLLTHWTGQLLRMLDTLHTPRSIHYPTSPLCSTEPLSSSSPLLYSVVHKDVKIKNVLVSGTGYLHLVDFGCAVIVPSLSSTTADMGEGSKCMEVARQALLQTTGTVTTMAPELKPNGVVAESSSLPLSRLSDVGGGAMRLWVRGAVMDVYGLGVVLLEMMNSRQTNGATEAEYQRLRSLVGVKQQYAKDEDSCSSATGMASLIGGMIQPCPLLRYQACTRKEVINNNNNSSISNVQKHNSIFNNNHTIKNETTPTTSSPMRSILNSQWGASNNSIGTHAFPAQFTTPSPSLLLRHQVDDNTSRVEELVGDHWNMAICPGFSEEVEEEVDMQTLGL